MTTEPDEPAVFRVLLTVGTGPDCVAELEVTGGAIEVDYRDPLQVPAERIARESGVPVEDLPGKAFHWTGAGFRLADGE